MYTVCSILVFVRLGARKELKKVEKYKVEIYFTQRIAVNTRNYSEFTCVNNLIYVQGDKAVVVRGKGWVDLDFGCSIFLSQFCRTPICLGRIWQTLE